MNGDEMWSVTVIDPEYWQTAFLFYEKPTFEQVASYVFADAYIPEPDDVKSYEYSPQHFGWVCYDGEVEISLKSEPIRSVKHERV